MGNQTKSIFVFPITNLIFKDFKVFRIKIHIHWARSQKDIARPKIPSVVVFLYLESIVRADEEHSLYGRCDKLFEAKLPVVDAGKYHRWVLGKEFYHIVEHDEPNPKERNID